MGSTTPWGGGFSPLEFLYGFVIALVAQMNFTAVLAIILAVLVLACLWCVCKVMRNRRNGHG